MGVEKLQLECELLQEELKTSMLEKDKTKLAHQKAKMEMLEQQWMVHDDKLEFLRGLSELAAKGGGDVMLAWHMYERAKEADSETGMNKEFNKLRKEAEKSMTERSTRDQAVLAARQLGLGAVQNLDGA